MLISPTYVVRVGSSDDCLVVQIAYELKMRFDAYIANLRGPVALLISSSKERIDNLIMFAVS